jgi:rod shape-determining protein MreB and related proteins
MRLISAYIKKQYRLLIGERTAEEIKINLDAGNGIGKYALLEVRGKDLVRGMPKLIQISAGEIADVLSDIINVIAETVKRTLEMAPLESSIDIMEKGIVMTGGSSLLKGLSKAVSEKTGVPVYVSEDPMDCAVIGAAKYYIHQKLIERCLRKSIQLRFESPTYAKDKPKRKTKIIKKERNKIQV